MVIVFDMDNTLTDELGSSVRPGIRDLLKQLKQEGHTLILWTNSTKQRAKSILFEHKLLQFFSTRLFREDYDPNNKNLRKDIRKVKGDILIDDDPKEIEFVRSIKKRGFCVVPFRKGMKLRADDCEEIYRFVNHRRGFLSKFHLLQLC